MNVILVGCTGLYGERIDQTLKGIRQIRPYVDRMAVVIDETVTEKQKQKLREAGAEVYHHPWQDSMVLMRNQLLQKVQTGDWVCFFDPDEVYDAHLCEDLRKLIERAEQEGIGMLLVAAHDETLMNDGSVSKSVSGFKKPWIYKKNLGVHYEGVGETQNVHETPVLAPNTKVVALPDEYFYTHYKQEWEIWERAARNVFMCGGGGNVGARNPQWVRLRETCDELGIKNWTQARAYFRRGKIDARLLQWLIDNRYEGEDYEHEMQDFFRWYKWLHPEELEGYDPVMTPKKGSPKEVEEYIKQTYKEVIGKEISEEDKYGLAELIQSGQIKREHLPRVIQAYKQDKPDAIKPVDAGEKVRLPVPVDVDVRITEELFEKALVKSKVYWEKIKPRMDLGRFIENLIWDKAKFYHWFYENRNDMALENILEYVETRGVDTVALCIMGYSAALPMIIASIETCGNYVDEIHVQGDDFTEEDINVLKMLSVDPTSGLRRRGPPLLVHIEPWKEEFSDYKNKLLRHANTHWVAVFDHDEIPTKEFAEQLREIIAKSEEGEKYNLVQLNSIGITVNDEGEVIHTGESVPGKQNLHLNVKDPYYGNPHIWLKPDYYHWKPAKVPYAYKHIKGEMDDIIRAARNVFLGGGGDNWGSKNELWVELRQICSELKIQTWHEFHEYLKKGNIDPRLKDLFERLHEKPWHDPELKAFQRYYEYLHPEEKQNG